MSTSLEPCKGMAPGGEYNKSSKSQRMWLLDYVAPSVMSELRQLAHLDRTLCLADLGCSEGGNAAEMLERIMAVRRTNLDVAFVDLPTNDWATVREVLSRVDCRVVPLGGSDAPSGGVFVDGDEVAAAIAADRQAGETAPWPRPNVLLCGLSFYQQVLPSGSVDLAWSGTAMHWLSALPTPLTGCLYGGDQAFRDTLAPNHPERLAWERQAARDWETTLRHRAKELAPGGIMVIGLVAHLAGSGSAPVVPVALQTLRGMVADGTLSEEAERRVVLPMYTRDEAELRAPFGQANDFEGLSMESLSVVTQDSPYWHDSDPGAFAAGVVGAWAAVIRTMAEAAFPPAAEESGELLASQSDGGASGGGDSGTQNGDDSHRASAAAPPLPLPAAEGGFARLLNEIRNELMANPQKYKKEFAQAYITLRRRK